MASNPSRYKTVVSEESSDIKVIKVNNIPQYETTEYCLEDNDDFTKYIEDIEKEVRNSFEYQEMIQYFRNNMDMNRCSALGGVSNKEETKIKIHIHHSPITLYEITVIVQEKRRFYHESLDIEDVAKEVCYVHYCLLVGLIPLCETVHDLVHNEFYFIPNYAVMGGYDKFLEMYDPWVPTQIKQKLDRLEKYSETFDETENMKILEAHYIYLDIEGMDRLPSYQELANSMQTRMKALRENGYSMEPKPLVYFHDENGNITMTPPTLK